jgi:signal transduction histidine kinase
MDPLLDTAPFGFLVVCDDGLVEAANRTVAEILDVPVGSHVGRHIDSLLTPPSRIFYQSHFFPILKLQGRVSEVYLAMVSGTGEEVPVLLNATRREADGGARSDWAVVPMRTRNEYENEILKARKAAEEASSVKDVLLSFVSHELRSPLSVIMGWATVLARADLDPVKKKHGLEAIERNAKLQLKLVDDLIDHARLASGKVKVELAPVYVHAVLGRVLEDLGPTARAKGVAIDGELGHGTVRIAADVERLQQVFWNILGNAVKFTPASGTVVVRLVDEGGWAEVSVTDSGKGITAEFLPYVFESFRQEESRAMRAEGGLGLGMAVTRQLVELHGGSVSAASPGPGQGATFTVRLPALLTNEHSGRTAAREGDSR